MENELKKAREGKKVCCIVGMATTNRSLTPWDDENVEIWTLNESPAKRFGYVKRVDRHFQLHPQWNFEREGNQNDPEHGQWLKIQKFPIYMQEKFEGYPTAVKYPLEEVFEHFQIPLEGKDHWREFDSTFPYMLALALYEGFDRIEVYGFEMGSETEYAYQRPNVHLWLGMARMSYLLTGKPEIYIPDECRLLGWGSKLYGYEMVMGINPMEIEIDRNQFGNQAGKLKEEISMIEGRQRELEEIIQNQRKGYDDRAVEIRNKKQDPKLAGRRLQELEKEMNAKLKPFLQRQQYLQNEKMKLVGAMKELEGAHKAAVNWLSRYNSQQPPYKLEAPKVNKELLGDVG